MSDAADVARELWPSWLSGSTREVVESSLGDADLAPRVAVFLAAAHDVGKISHEFAVQNPGLHARMIRVGFPEGPSRSSNDGLLYHSAVSGAALTTFLLDLGVSPGNAGPLSMILAGHHGTFPDTLPALPDESTLWAQSRREALEYALLLADLEPEDLAYAAGRTLSQPAQVVLTGFVIVSDWVASNDRLFPYPEADEVLGKDSDRADHALSMLDLPFPWAPAPPSATAELFKARFDLPPGARPRPAQTDFVDCARSVTEPSLMILEAPTGEGKTEAALAAAEILASTFGCGGITIALPTCATSDAMFERAMAWLDRAVPSDDIASAALTHGRASFNPEYVELMSTGSVSGIHDPDAPARERSVTAHWWLRGRKTAALADFTVGTIDQVLFAGLRSRHLMLRHLGLSGKVVILDEVHAADAYMSVYLDRTLEWLGALGTPVIALSATLPPGRRAAMLAAYRRGRRVVTAAEVRRNTSVPSWLFDAVYAATGYPLTSIIGSDEPVLHVSEASGRAVDYTVEFLGDDVDDLLGEVVPAVESGACVAVVRNTVARAQHLYAVLVDKLGLDRVRLVHSRFTAAERQRMEQELRSDLGPPGPLTRRPSGLVVVATQVIEQSLDIDVDLMLTDIAPVDLIVQRAGRLHRHARSPGSRPACTALARLLITGTAREPGGDLDAIDQGTAWVYGTSAILRAIATMQDHLAENDNVLHSPDDVPGLVRRAYSEDFTPPESWARTWDAAESERLSTTSEQQNRAGTYLVAGPKKGWLRGWNTVALEAQDGGAPEARGMAQVRDAENSIDVILVQEREGRVYSLPSPFLSDRGAEPVDDDFGLDNTLARAVATCSVSLPAWTSRGRREEQLIDALERGGLPGWQKSVWLKGQLCLRLDADMRAVIGDLEVEYSRELGLQVRRRPARA